MIVDAEITINGSVTATWRAITDIEHAASILRGVERIEILERPPNGLVGLKWRETRLLFGKPASVDKWITDAVEPDVYRTRAEDGGFVFLTTLRISPSGDGVALTSVHETMPQGLVATLQSIPMRVFFRGVIRKAILQDLGDIKAAVERG